MQGNHQRGRSGLVGYEILYEDEACSSNTPPPAISLKVRRRGILAMTLMERAVDEDRANRFSATYFDSELGYFIVKINGTASTESCFWKVCVKAANGTVQAASVGVSNLIIKNSETLQMKYESF